MVRRKVVSESRKQIDPPIKWSLLIVHFVILVVSSTYTTKHQTRPSIKRGPRCIRIRSAILNNPSIVTAILPALLSRSYYVCNHGESSSFDRVMPLSTGEPICGENAERYSCARPRIAKVREILGGVVRDLVIVDKSVVPIAVTTKRMINITKAARQLETMQISLERRTELENVVPFRFRSEFVSESSDL